jgi:redox-regulated HSP33 family molecular chaperone
LAKTTRKTPQTPAREQTVTLKLSGPEYQLIAYAASKSNVRGINVWMRTKLLEAARAKLSDKVADEILSGKGTVTLLKESLTEAKKGRKGADVIPIDRDPRT